MLTRLEYYIDMFIQINCDCLESEDKQDQFVPLTAENAEYYQSQLENMEVVGEEIDEFVQWIKTQ